MKKQRKKSTVYVFYIQTNRCRLETLLIAHEAA